MRAPVTAKIQNPPNFCKRIRGMKRGRRMLFHNFPSFAVDDADVERAGSGLVDADALKGVVFGVTFADADGVESGA